MSSSSSSRSPVSKTTYFGREQTIGKQVVAPNATIVGVVKDTALSTDGKIALQVERKDPPSGEDPNLLVSSEEIQAVGDVILLRAEKTQGHAATASPTSSGAFGSSSYVAPPPYPGAVTTGKTCTGCGFANSLNAKFCIKCGASLST